jgi:5-methylcytosine-specific restriction endonuclease McrA
MGNRKGLIDSAGRECSICGVYKKWSEFYKNKNNKTLHDPACKECVRTKRGHTKRKVFKVDDFGRECTCCDTYKTWDAFTSRKGRVKNKSNVCKECIRNKEGSFPKKQYKINDIGRECTSCGEFKDWGSFYDRQGGINGKRAKCKECYDHKVKTYTEINIDKIKLRNKGYIQRNKENISIKAKQRNKGGASYETYKDQLTPFESPRSNKKGELLVKCAKCRKYFVPSLQYVIARSQVIKGKANGGLYLYCSDKCKLECDVYYQMKYQKGHLAYGIRELEDEFRNIVLSRDKYKCKKCGSVHKLCVHHVIPVKINPMIQLDLDNAITLCKKCHMRIHKKEFPLSYLSKLECPFTQTYLYQNAHWEKIANEWIDYYEQRNNNSFL